MHKNIPVFDKTKFTLKPYLQKVEKPWGYELIFTTPDLPFTGKVIHINAGKRWSLQIHDSKQESWFLLNGRVKMFLEDKNGKLVEQEMRQGVGYTSQIGQRHRLQAITDCDVLESSTPETGNTYRLEDDYKRPTETEELRKKPNRGWEK